MIRKRLSNKQKKEAEIIKIQKLLRLDVEENEIDSGELDDLGDFGNLKNWVSL